MAPSRATALLGIAMLVGCAAAPTRPAPKIVLPEESAAPPATADESAPAEEEGEDGEVEAADVPATAETNDPCPADMVLVDGRFCIDKYEASLVEILPDGTEKPYPHYLPVDGHEVRAVSVPGVYPQGFISEIQARDACAASNKRLCTHAEWKTACMGPDKTTFPYGDTRMTGVCRDNGKSAVIAVFGAKAVAASTSFLPPRKGQQAAKANAAKATVKKRKNDDKKAAPKKVASRRTDKNAKRKDDKPVRATKKIAAKTKRIAAKKSVRPQTVDPGVWAKLNDPALGQVEGALAKTGEHVGCVNGWGAFDMVGNLHEWVATDPSAPNGTFAGGYYLDTSQNGDGCHYRTVAHAHDYHDYSTGFRCCADPAGAVALK